MKLHQWLSTGTLSALAMVAASASAQDAPPAAEPQKDAEPEELFVPTKLSQITLGYTGFRPNYGLSRYARPTQGLSLHDLTLFNPLSEKSPFARLIIRGMHNQDSMIQGDVALNQGRTLLRGTRRDNAYYDFGWVSKGRSEDKETEFSMDHSFTTNFGAFAFYKKNERWGRYPAPRDADHTHTQVLAGGVGGNMLGGNLGVTASERITTDDRGNQPKTLQRTVSGNFARDLGTAVSLEGSAAYSRIEQRNLPSSSVRSYALAGNWDLGASTGLSFQLGQQDIDLNTVQNAYTRQRFLYGARLMHRWPGWSLQVGMRHKESERLRADQSYVDVPKWNVYEARLAGKVGPARLTLRGTWEDLLATAIMTTTDKRQMLWDDRAMFQAKLDGGGELFQAYGAFTYKYQQNKQRGVELGWKNFVLGGSYVLTPSLNAYAEYAVDDYRAKGSAIGAPSLGFYFPNSRSATAGVNWAHSPRLSASANFNYYESGDVRGTQLTLSLRQKLSLDQDLELVVAPWRHEDRQYDLTSYRTTFLMARYTVRF